jgi:hypothetical protein
LEALIGIRTQEVSIRLENSVLGVLVGCSTLFEAVDHVLGKVLRLHANFFSLRGWRNLFVNGLNIYLGHCYLALDLHEILLRLLARGLFD